MGSKSQTSTIVSVIEIAPVSHEKASPLTVKLTKMSPFCGAKRHPFHGGAGKVTRSTTTARQEAE